MYVCHKIDFAFPNVHYFDLSKLNKMLINVYNKTT